MVKSAIALGAMLVSGAALAAPESLSKVDTDKGEVLLEVLATGVSTAKILKVSTVCDLLVNAWEKDEAAKLLKKAEQDLAKGMRAAGVGSAVLDFSAPSKMASQRADYATAVATEAAVAGAVAAVKDAAIDDVAATEEYVDNAATQYSNSRRVGVSTGSGTDMQAARAVMAEFGCEEDYQFVRRPKIELADAAAAKAKATTSAIAMAKAQAESYAAALNMKVVRMLRVSETGAIREFFGPESEFIMQEMRNEGSRWALLSNDVPVNASLSVDFVLGPKN
jgi:hypothetical protein